MKWFKFYGQDFLTDSKMRLLSVEEKMCWVVLMCLANSEDKEGKILFVNEDEVMKQAGIEENTPMWMDTKGFLDKFKELSMLEISVTKVTGGVTKSNKALRYDIRLTNFDRRQTENLSNAERQKRHREKTKKSLKQSKISSNDSNEDICNDSNARIDKIRIDKNRIDNKISRFAPPTPEEVKKYCLERKNDVDPDRWHNFYSAKNWMIGKNKMKDWKAAVRTWEKSDSNKRKIIKL